MNIPAEAGRSRSGERTFRAILEYPYVSRVNLEYSLLEYPGQRILSTLLPRGNSSDLVG